MTNWCGTSHPPEKRTGPYFFSFSYCKPLLALPFQVYGPEASMTGICKLAIDYISQFDANSSDTKRQKRK